MRRILETERLMLREYTAEDLDNVYALLSHPVTMQFWPEPFDSDGARKWLQRSISSYQENGFGRYAIVLKSAGNYIGDCGFMLTEIDGRQECDLGYIIDKDFWGHGYATEAATACLRYGLDGLKLNRIVANMETKHLASKAVAEKTGFKLEKIFSNSRNRNLPTFLLSIGTER